MTGLSSSLGRSKRTWKVDDSHQSAGSNLKILFTLSNIHCFKYLSTPRREYFATKMNLLWEGDVPVQHIYSPFTSELCHCRRETPATSSVVSNQHRYHPQAGESEESFYYNCTESFLIFQILIYILAIYYVSQCLTLHWLVFELHAYGTLHHCWEALFQNVLINLFYVAFSFVFLFSPLPTEPFSTFPTST